MPPKENLKGKLFAMKTRRRILIDIATHLNTLITNRFKLPSVGSSSGTCSYMLTLGKDPAISKFIEELSRPYCTKKNTNVVHPVYVPTTYYPLQQAATQYSIVRDCVGVLRARHGSPQDINCFTVNPKYLKDHIYGKFITKYLLVRRRYVRAIYSQALLEIDKVDKKIKRIELSGESSHD